MTVTFVKRRPSKSTGMDLRCSFSAGTSIMSRVGTGAAAGLAAAGATAGAVTQVRTRYGA